MEIDIETAYLMALAHMDKLTRQKKNHVLDIVNGVGYSLIRYMACGINDRNYWHSVSDYTDVNLDDKDMDALMTLGPRIDEYASQLDEMKEKGYGVVSTFRDYDYPQQMQKMLGEESPILWYCKGDKSLLNQPHISIVGSRKANMASLEWAKMIGEKKGTGEGRVVVSGYAGGSDRAGMYGAMQSGGKSIAIVPQGLNTFFAEHKEAARLIDNGDMLVMSSYPLNAKWTAQQAIDRNTHIYAMSEDTYVAQSEDHGGTWDGANKALKRGWTVKVRAPKNEEEAKEMSNSILIGKGAMAIDQNGEPMKWTSEKAEDENEKVRKEVIRLLNIGEYSASDLVKRLSLDWSTRKMTNLVNSIEGVMSNGEKKKKYTLKKLIQINLF